MTKAKAHQIKHLVAERFFATAKASDEVGNFADAHARLEAANSRTTPFRRKLAKRSTGTVWKEEELSNYLS